MFPNEFSNDYIQPSRMRHHGCPPRMRGFEGPYSMQPRFERPCVFGGEQYCGQSQSSDDSIFMGLFGAGLGFLGGYAIGKQLSNQGKQAPAAPQNNPPAGQPASAQTPSAPPAAAPPAAAPPAAQGQPPAVTVPVAAQAPAATPAPAAKAPAPKDTDVAVTKLNTAVEKAKVSNDFRTNEWADVIKNIRSSDKLLKQKQAGVEKSRQDANQVISNVSGQDAYLKEQENALTSENINYDKQEKDAKAQYDEICAAADKEAKEQNTQEANKAAEQKKAEAKKEYDSLVAQYEQMKKGNAEMFASLERQRAALSSVSKEQYDKLKACDAQDKELSGMAEQIQIAKEKYQAYTGYTVKS